MELKITPKNMEMKELKLDIFELGYLLYACFAGLICAPAQSVDSLTNGMIFSLLQSECNFSSGQSDSHTMNVGTARKKTTNRTSSRIAVAVARI